MNETLSAWMQAQQGPGDVTVLIVDDQASLRDLNTCWLTGAGYRCLQAHSAEQARHILQSENVQLVVSDVGIANAGEHGLLQWMSEEKTDVAAVMLASVGDLNTAVTSLLRGASGYLTKPVDREELLIQIGNALERRRLRIENDQYLRELERQVREQTLAIRQAHEETIHRLLRASRYRDEETGAHVRRTGLFSEVLAAALGWPEDQVECIRIAAPMHDIGKIGIPDGILRKPERLTPVEFAAMKTHARIGARMLEGSDTPILSMAYAIALNHHEHWDGNGYPRGIAGEEIPESARIVSLVDVYDALSHDRVYRPALPEDKVLSILRSGRGTQFEPRIVDCFFETLPEMRAINAANPDEPPQEHCMNAWWASLEASEAGAAELQLLSL